MCTVGQPFEAAYAMSSLVYECVMDEFPKLKILVAHGGGYLPFYTGRHDNDYRYGRSPQLKGDFSSYLPRFFYDAVLQPLGLQAADNSKESFVIGRSKAEPLPFIWVGGTLTLQRLRDAGESPWLVVAFFVPVVNLLLFFVLVLLPPLASALAPASTASVNRRRLSI